MYYNINMRSARLLIYCYYYISNRNMYNFTFVLDFDRNRS